MDQNSSQFTWRLVEKVALAGIKLVQRTVLRYSDFQLEGRRYRYFVHRYNCTWGNERAVEVPVVYDFLERHYRPGMRVLELGNVMSHYADALPLIRKLLTTDDYIVIDKYEKSSLQSVRNEDIVEFVAEKPYDLIGSISTLEHIGFDEAERLRISRCGRWIN